MAHADGRKLRQIVRDSNYAERVVFRGENRCDLRTMAGSEATLGVRNASGLDEEAVHAECGWPVADRRLRLVNAGINERDVRILSSIRRTELTCPNLRNARLPNCPRRVLACLG
jgi:hypothetical protein